MGYSRIETATLHERATLTASLSYQIMQHPPMYICEEPPEYSELDPNQVSLDGIEPGSQHDGAGSGKAVFTKLSTEMNERLLNKYVPMYCGYKETGHRVVHGEVSSWSKVERDGASARFTVGDSHFQLVLHRAYNEPDGYMSFHLECLYKDHSKEHTHMCMYFCLALSNPTDPSVCWKQAFEHRFTHGSNMHGTGKSIERKVLKTIQDEHNKPIVERDQVRVSAYVRVVQDETGIMWTDGLRRRSLYPITRCAGVRSHPDYPYLGMLLQTLYHMKAVRHAIYLIPTHGIASMRPVVFALKRVFLNLESSTTFVHTGELVRALRHETGELRAARDQHAFDRSFLGHITDALHNTVAAGIIRKLFRGRVRTTICSPDIPLKTVDIEDFYCLQLTTRGCLNLHESIQRFCQARVLAASNLHCGLQRGGLGAYKTTTFDALPPVLHVYLAHAQPDASSRDASSTASSYEYPPAIDLSEFITTPDSSSAEWKYVAYGVYLHSQDSSVSSYTFYLCPGKLGKWVKFAGDSVMPERQYSVFTANPEPDPVPIVRKSPRAPGARQGCVCALIYIREDLRELVLRIGDIHQLHAVLSQ